MNQANRCPYLKTPDLGDTLCQAKNKQKKSNNGNLGTFQH